MDFNHPQKHKWQELKRFNFKHSNETSSWNYNHDVKEYSGTMQIVPQSMVLSRMINRQFKMPNYTHSMVQLTKHY